MSDTNSLNSLEQTSDAARPAEAPTLPTADTCGPALFECLGVGGMGEIYRCGDDALQRDLAVKILKTELRGDADAESRFLREARLTGSLQHPGIVPIHQLGRFADGRPCYTMKLVRGRTFAEMLHDEPAGPERLPRLLAVLEKVCQAVAFAYSKGVIHRDLKPANVMVGEFGEVQVMDWGLAKELSRDEPATIKATENAKTAARREEAAGLSRAGAVLGTPAYMPPEQAVGDWDIVDERADVFALGAVLCEVLTGRPPYQGIEREDVLQRAQHGDVAKALERLEKCGADAALVNLCRACLAAERLQRPRHAGVVAERLAAYQAEVRERLRQAELERARAEVTAREERKRRRLVAALALAGLLSLAGGVAAWRQWQRRRAEADEAVAKVLSEARLLRQQAQADPLTVIAYDKAVSVAGKASDLARAGDASESMRQQAGDLLAEVKQEAEEAAKDRRLLARLLEARGPHEGPKYRRDDKGRLMALTTPTAEEQFASAFRDWGLDVDATPTAEAAAHVKPHLAIRTEVIAALDEWASQRLVDRKPEAEWRRMADLAAMLDDDPGSLQRELRAILARGLLRGNAERARLRQLAERIDSAKEPVLGLLTLTRALRMAGEEALAERLLRKALTVRPREVVLYHTLGDLLARQRPAEAVQFYLAARALRPDLGVALAEVLQRSGREDEALDLLAALVKESPDNPYLHFQQGYALHNKGDVDGALDGYKKTLELDPKYALALNNLGAILCDHKHDYDRAIACFKKAVELNPQFANFHNYLGVALANKGDVDGAFACFRKAIELEPTNALFHSNLGVALANKGDVDDAIACHKKAIALNPKLAQAHSNLGIALHNKGDVDDAMACYKKAIELDPKDAKAHGNLGAILCDQKRDYDRAIACFKKTIELNPRDALAHNNLGVALDNKGDLDGAIACWHKALELDPKLALTHYKLGNALYTKGDLDGAIPCFRKAIELNPKDTQAHGNLGLALCGKGDLDGAIACYKKAIALNPKDALAHGNLGLALCSKGDMDGAVVCWHKALELDPKLATSHYNLGIALAAKHDLDGAIARYKKAIELDPKYAEAHCNLGQALRQQGRFAEAVAYLRRGHEFGSKRPGWRYPSAQWLRDAERLAALDSKLSAVLRGEASPANSAEAVTLAQMCQQYNKRHIAATRLYADAFAADPKLAADWNAQHRYHAARNAALAAAGQDEAARLLPDKVAAMFRNWALGWLRDELTACVKLAEQNNPAVKQTIQQRLAHWRRDADLASVREETALDRLGAPERAAWQALWRNVDELVTRLAKKTD